jgi:hypothetical protein
MTTTRQRHVTVRSSKRGWRWRQSAEKRLSTNWGRSTTYIRSRSRIGEKRQWSIWKKPLRTGADEKLVAVKSTAMHCTSRSAD